MNPTDDIDQLLASIDAGLKQLGREGGSGGGPRRGSRFVDQGASRSLVEHVARGGSYSVDEEGARKAIGSEPRTRLGGLAPHLKAMAEGTGSAGGFLVPPEMHEEVVGLIRTASAVMRLNPRVIPVKKLLNVTSISSGATAYYVAENAQIPVSEMTFAEAVLLQPKNLAALLPISNRLLRDANESPDVEQLIREDLAEVVAVREDLAFLRGSGTGEPRGIRNHSGLTAAPSLGANGGFPSLAQMKQMVANVRSAGSRLIRPGWIFHPKVLAYFETLEEQSGGSPTGRLLADNPAILTVDLSGSGGTFLGYRYQLSSQIPTNLVAGSNSDATEVYFGDFSEAFVGEEDELMIEVPSEASYDATGSGGWVSSFQNDQSVFRVTLQHDFALRRPQFFSVMTGVRTGV